MNSLTPLSNQNLFRLHQTELSFDFNDGKGDLSKLFTAIQNSKGNIQVIIYSQKTDANQYHSSKLTHSYHPETKLTKREIEVLELIAQGMNSSQIADKLFVSYHTIKTHRKRLLCKLGVNNAISLIDKAKRIGYLD